MTNSYGLLSATQAAGVLGISRTRLHVLTAQGRLLPLRLGKYLYFSVEELERFVKSREVTDGK